MNKELIEEIVDSIDIVDYISEAVNLRRRGANFVGLCPFHQEKTPSFTVSPEKKIFKCFGCGKAGNVITFAVEYYGFTYPEAIRELAKRAGIKIEAYSPAKKEEISHRDKILQALEFAKKYFQRILLTQSGTVALAYLKNRGYTSNTIQEFEIGYSPSGWDTLFREMTSKGFSPEILLDAGLVKKKEGTENEFYDVFRERIMFPIYNATGKVVGFGGRILKEVDNQPKYINSPQTEVFDKSKLLFGLFKGRNEIRSKESVVLVEGYADVIALHQAGIKNAIASCGTSLTMEQLNQIARYCKTIYIAYDGDEAGQKATERAIQLALPLGFEVLVVKLIENEDPDSIVKKFGAQAFHNLIDNAKSFLEYLFELAQSKGILSRPAKKSQFIQYCLELISKIPDKLQHYEYIQTLANLLLMPYSQLEALFHEKQKIEKEISKNVQREEKTFLQTTQQATKILPEEEYLLLICLEQPEAIEVLENVYKFDKSNMITQEGAELFSIVYSHQGKNPLNSILSNIAIDEATKNYFINLVFSKEEVSKHWERFGFAEIEKDFNRILRDAFTRLKIKKIEFKTREIQNLIANDPMNQEKYLKELQELFRTKQKLLNSLKK